MLAGGAGRRAFDLVTGLRTAERVSVGVMDAESGRDAVANLAVRGGPIVAVGWWTSAATGQDPESQRLLGAGWVTTAMELGIRRLSVDTWHVEREG